MGRGKRQRLGAQEASGNGQGRGEGTSHTEARVIESVLPGFKGN